MKSVDLGGGSPGVHGDAFGKCLKLEHSNNIATGKMSIAMFRRFARIDISRRVVS